MGGLEMLGLLGTGLLGNQLGGEGGDIWSRLTDPEGILFPHEGMANKKNGTDTTATPIIPEALQSLIDRTAGRQSSFQDALWAQMMPGAGAGWPGAGGGDDGGGGGDDGGGGGGGDDGGGLPPVVREIPGDHDGDNDGHTVHKPDWWRDYGPGDDPFDFLSIYGSPSLRKDRLDAGSGGAQERDLPGAGGAQNRDQPGSTGGGSLTSVWDLLNRVPRVDQPGNPPVRDTPGGGGGTPPASWIPSGDWSPSEQGILGDNSRGIAGSNQLLDDAVAAIYGLTNAPEEYASARGIFGRMGQGPEEWSSARELIDGMGTAPEEYRSAREIVNAMRGQSARQADGSGLQEDPAYLAAMSAFDSAMRPIIENQASLSGLGRSTAMTNATASQQAQTLLPMVQDYIGRQERSIDRELDTMGRQVTDLMGLGDRAVDRRGRSIESLLGLGDRRMSGWGTQAEGLMGLGDRSYQRRGDQIAGLTGMGDYGRGIAQDQLDSRYNDWLRRAGLFESSMSGPAGLFGSTIGGNTHSDKNGKSE